MAANPEFIVEQGKLLLTQLRGLAAQNAADHGAPKHSIEEQANLDAAIASAGPAQESLGALFDEARLLHASIMPLRTRELSAMKALSAVYREHAEVLHQNLDLLFDVRDNPYPPESLDGCILIDPRLASIDAFLLKHRAFLGRVVALRAEFAAIPKERDELLRQFGELRAKASLGTRGRTDWSTSRAASVGNEKIDYFARLYECIERLNAFIECGHAVLVQDVDDRTPMLQPLAVGLLPYERELDRLFSSTMLDCRRNEEARERLERSTAAASDDGYRRKRR